MKTINIIPTNADISELRNLYETAFPVEEQIPYEDLKHLLAVMPLTFTAYYDGDTFVGLTMVLNSEKLNWFWYFAVSEEMRGKGYGQRILTALTEHYSDKLLILDIESPKQECKNKEQRIRRHAFYLRNGFHDTDTAKSFEGIDYTIMAKGEGSFTQRDYDDIINNLRKYWENIPDEEIK